jgi:hypothetical protein
VIVPERLNELSKPIVQFVELSRYFWTKSVHVY